MKTDSLAAGRRTVRRTAARAFTLLEVMIVIVIILALGGLVAVNLFGAREEAQQNLTRAQLNSLDDALKQFNLAFGRYPTEEETLAVLWDKELLDPDADSSRWRMFTAKRNPKDQWGNEYQYRAESMDMGFGDPDADPSSMRPYELWSNGPDGEEGTPDDIKLGGDSEGSEDGLDGLDFGPGGG